MDVQVTLKPDTTSNARSDRVDTSGANRNSAFLQEIPQALTELWRVAILRMQKVLQKVQK
jgi:hypothetical protein